MHKGIRGLTAVFTCCQRLRRAPFRSALKGRCCSVPTDGQALSPGRPVPPATLNLPRAKAFCVPSEPVSQIHVAAAAPRGLHLALEQGPHRQACFQRWEQGCALCCRDLCFVSLRGSCRWHLIRSMNQAVLTPVWQVVRPNLGLSVPFHLTQAPLTTVGVVHANDDKI